MKETLAPRAGAARVAPVRRLAALTCLHLLALLPLGAVDVSAQASGSTGQSAGRALQPIDLIELISLFLVPESVDRTVGDWYAWSGPASPIVWNPNEVRWDERRATFVRDGSAVVTLGGAPIHAAGSSEPARWPIRMFGPREGYTRVAIASRIASRELSLDLPAQLGAQGVTYEAKRCDAAEPAGGNRLYEIVWPEYRKAWLHHQWGCGDAGCAAYVSISLVEPEPATLQSMPNTECGVPGGPGAARVAGGEGGAGGAGPALLFRDGAGGLTDAEQLEVFSALGLAVAADGAGFVDTVCGQPAGAEIQILDLNGDGTSEVLAIFGNSCTSGHTGSSVALFIKHGGAYRLQLGFPGASADPLETGNEGYPDLQIGGPGYCFPVWRWNGSEYVHHRNEPQAEGGCAG